MSTLILFLSVIFLITVTARVDFERSDANRSAPWGLIWAASYSVYLAIPFGLRKISRYTNIADISPSLSERILERQATALSVFAIGFAMGYAVYATLRKSKNISHLLSRVASTDGDSCIIEERVQRGTFNPDWIFTLATGGFTSAAVIISALTDFSDRYNSGAAEGIAARVLSTLAVNGFLSSFFLFIAGIKARDLASTGKRPNIAKVRMNSNLCYLALMAEALILLAYALKSGSRSIMLMCMVSMMAGYIYQGHNRGKVASAKLIITVGLISFLAMPLGETVRIARSSSDFYKFNPLHASKLLVSSLTINISPTEFAIRNRRDELSDGAYITESEYKKVLIELRPNKTDLQISGSEQREIIGPTRSPADLTIVAQAKDMITNIQAIGTAALFHSKEDSTRQAVKLGLDPKSLSSGEQINLPSELYSKGGLRFSLIGGFALGLILAGTREITTLTAERLFFEAGLYIKSIPLGLLAGNLSLPLITQAWLLFVQLPKMILVSIALGAIVRLARVYSHKSEDRIDKWRHN